MQLGHSIALSLSHSSRRSAGGLVCINNRRGGEKVPNQEGEEQEEE